MDALVTLRQLRVLISPVSASLMLGMDWLVLHPPKTSVPVADNTTREVPTMSTVGLVVFMSELGM